MSLQTAIFYFFMVLAGLSAVSILFVKNVFKAALLLLLSLLSVAAIYIFSFAEFVAITQIMIYAGGIVIVIIFGIMITTKISGSALTVENTNLFSGLLAAGALLVLLLKFFVFTFSMELPHSPSSDTLTDTGIALVTTFLLPFELAGIFLLIALVGAAVVVTSANKIEKS
jgi:NADH:ubiquinone oxidoreductase subunit 6 (subunit J)